MTERGAHGGVVKPLGCIRGIANRADIAIGEHPVMIDVRARRFLRDAIDCGAGTFAEQIVALT